MDFEFPSHTASPQRIEELFPELVRNRVFPKLDLLRDAVSLETAFRKPRLAERGSRSDLRPVDLAKTHTLVVPSSNQVMHDVTVHIGQSEIATAEAIGQSLVVDS